MDIAEFSSKFDEDSEGYVVAVRNVEEDIIVHVEMDDWVEPGARRGFELHAMGVVEAKAYPTWCGEVEFSEEHPLLWNHNHPWRDLYFTTAPSIAAEMIGILYETHERIFQGWRPLADYLNSFVVQAPTSNGLLASGPEPIIAEYVAAIQHLLKVNTVRCHREPHPSKALLLGESFVICADVAVSEVPIKVS